MQKESKTVKYKFFYFLATLVMFVSVTSANTFSYIGYQPEVPIELNQ